MLNKKTSLNEIPTERKKLPGQVDRPHGQYTSKRGTVRMSSRQIIREITGNFSPLRKITAYRRPGPITKKETSWSQETLPTTLEVNGRINKKRRDTFVDAQKQKGRKKLAAPFVAPSEKAHCPKEYGGKGPADDRVRSHQPQTRVAGIPSRKRGEKHASIGGGGSRCPPSPGGLRGSPLIVKGR